MNRIWSEDQRDFIRQNAGTLTDSKIAAILTERIGGKREITLDAVRKQRQKMNIKKKSGRGVCAIVLPERKLRR